MTERELWAEVLLMAVEDALYGPPKKSGLRPADTIEDARAYVLEPNTDFELVCTLAGLDAREGIARKITAIDTKGPRARKPRAKFYTHKGRSLFLAQWADETSLPLSALRSRLQHGWSIDGALTEPLPTKAPSKPKGRKGATYTHDGRTLTLTQWAAETGLPRFVLQRRLHTGWTINRALTVPIQKAGHPSHTDPKTFAEMEAFEPELITDENAAAMTAAQTEEGRPKGRPSLLPVGPCQASPACAGSALLLLTDVTPDGSPCVNERPAA